MRGITSSTHARYSSLSPDRVEKTKFSSSSQSLVRTKINRYHSFRSRPCTDCSVDRTILEYHHFQAENYSFLDPSLISVVQLRLSLIRQDFFDFLVKTQTHLLIVSSMLRKGFYALWLHDCGFCQTVLFRLTSSNNFRLHSVKLASPKRCPIIPRSIISKWSPPIMITRVLNRSRFFQKTSMAFALKRLINTQATALRPNLFLISNAQHKTSKAVFKSVARASIVSR